MDNLLTLENVSNGSKGKPNEPAANFPNGAEIIFFPGVRYERADARSENKSSEETISS